MEEIPIEIHGLSRAIFSTLFIATTKFYQPENMLLHTY